MIGVKIPDVFVVLNEQHSLLPEQEELLDREFGAGKWKIYSVPQQGWTLNQMFEVIPILAKARAVVFASPVPFVLGQLSYLKGKNPDYPEVYVFHNDNREKKELPGGKIVYTVAKHGWKLLNVSLYHPRETKELRELEERKDLELITDSQEVRHIWEMVGAPGEESEPTGALVKISDGDYEEVWFTWWSAPYDLSARYERWL